MNKAKILESKGIGQESYILYINKAKHLESLKE